MDYSQFVLLGSKSVYIIGGLCCLIPLVLFLWFIWSMCRSAAHMDDLMGTR